MGKRPEGSFPSLPFPHRVQGRRHKSQSWPRACIASPEQLCGLIAAVFVSLVGHSFYFVQAMLCG